MDYASYLRVLLSVWVGLGLGQLIQALQRLIRYKGKVKWDWIPLVWAGFALLMFVQTWWAYFTLLQSPIWLNLFVFLLPLSVFVILYMISSSALPDLTKLKEESEVDLTEFYFSQQRYFFGLWAVLLLLALLIPFLVREHMQIKAEDLFRMTGIVIAILMATIRNRSFHVIVTLLAIAALTTFILLFSLKLH